MVPLLKQLGVDVRWNIIKGSDEFYKVTKKFHNALHNREEIITQGDYATFQEITEVNLKEMEINSDIVFVHDPQPAGLIARKRRLVRNGYGDAI